MSPKYNQVKEYYDMGMWNEKKLRNAVVHHWITEDEFRAITGKEYE